MDAKTVAIALASLALGVYVGQHPLADLVFGNIESSPSVVAPTHEAASTKSEEAAAPSAQEPIVIPTTQLSAGQRALLEKLGIDANAITITPAMIACAEAKLGAARLAEIQGGATPTFAEGASLLACYR